MAWDQISSEHVIEAWQQALFQHINNIEQVLEYKPVQIDEKHLDQTKKQHQSMMMHYINAYIKRQKEMMKNKLMKIQTQNQGPPMMQIINTTNGFQRFAQSQQNQGPPMIPLGKSMFLPSDGVLPAIIHPPRAGVLFFPRSFRKSSLTCEYEIIHPAVSAVSFPRDLCLLKPKTNSKGCELNLEVEMFSP